MVVQGDTKKDLDTFLYREKSPGETMKIKGGSRRQEGRSEKGGEQEEYNREIGWAWRDGN